MKLMEWMYGFEADILLWLQDYVRCGFLTPVMEFFSFICEYGIIWIIAGLLLLFPKKTRACGAAVLTALALSFIINNGILKNIIARARPFDMIEGLVPVIARPADYSFPSGHTAASFSAAFVILRSRPPIYWVPALVIAAITAFSRLYLGVHYPSDVLAGAVSGFLMAVLAEFIVSRVNIRNRPLK